MSTPGQNQASGVCHRIPFLSLMRPGVMEQLDYTRQARPQAK